MVVGVVVVVVVMVVVDVEVEDDVEDEVEVEVVVFSLHVLSRVTSVAFGSKSYGGWKEVEGGGQV